MKSYLGLLLAALLLTCCKGKSADAPAPAAPRIADSVATLPADTQAVVRVLTTDQVLVRHADSVLECRVCVDMPRGTDAWTLSVRRVLSEELRSLTLGGIQGDPDADTPLYGGSLADGRAMVTFYQRLSERDLRDNVDFAADADMPKCNYSVSLELDSQTSQYITYSAGVFSYLGGAHGSSVYYLLNISRATGRRLQHTVDATHLRALQPLLRRGVREYLQSVGETVTDAGLADALMVRDGIIPLPAATPALTARGVCFMYQQYEIACYAMGRITFTIPYSEIRPYLTAEARRMVPAGK